MAVVLFYHKRLGRSSYSLTRSAVFVPPNVHRTPLTSAPSSAAPFSHHKKDELPFQLPADSHQTTATTIRTDSPEGTPGGPFIPPIPSPGGRRPPPPPPPVRPDLGGPGAICARLLKRCPRFGRDCRAIHHNTTTTTTTTTKKGRETVNSRRCAVVT